MRRFGLIDWGAVAAMAVGSLGCMGGNTSPFASKTPAPTSPTFAQQTSAPAGQSSFSETATAGVAGVSKALLDNPLSRAVKGAFTSEAEAVAQVQTSPLSSNDPLSLGNTGKSPSPELFTSMGRMAEQAGNGEKAREYYEQAIALAPADADALLAYGHFHDRQGRLDQATRLYLDAIHADPQHAAAHNDLGLCYARQGQLPQALELVRKAAQLRPDRSIYRNNAAKVLVEMGRSQDAVNELAAVLSPAEAQYNIGCFLAQSGRHQEATSHFAAAVQIDPTMESARVWLSRLQPDAMTTQRSAAARVTSLAGTGAAAAQQQMGTMAYAYGAAQGAPENAAGGGHRLPVITNVRPVSAETEETPVIASLPQVPGGGAQQQASYPQQQASYGGASPSPWTPVETLPNTSSAWPNARPTPYLNASEERYQRNPPAAIPGSPAASGYTSGTVQESGAAPYHGASHASPWGNVPSPYHASAVEDTPFRYPVTAGTPSTAATAPQRSEPTTVVNPYTTVPAAANPWGPQRIATPNAAPVMR